MNSYSSLLAILKVAAALTALCCSRFAVSMPVGRDVAGALGTDGGVKALDEAARTPELMLDMYDCWEKAGRDMKSSAMDAIPSCQKAQQGRRSSGMSTRGMPAGSNTVESLLSNTSEDLEIYHKNGHPYNHSLQFQFKFNCSFNASKVSRTEVRVFYAGVTNPSTLTCNNNNNDLHLKLLKQNAENVTEKVDEITIPIDGESGWLIFDNFDASMLNWDMMCTHKLWLVVSGECGSVSMKQLGFDIVDTKQTLLVIYSAGGDEVMEQLMMLAANFTDILFNRTENNLAKRDATVSTATTITTIERCQMESFTVAFKNIGFPGIIMPESLALNRCTGTCQYPVITPKTYSLHARFLANAANYLGRDELQPCCIPTKFTKHNLLYAWAGITFTLSNVDLGVEQCGCR